MKFKTTIAALGAVAMLAVPAVTMAAPATDTSPTADYWVFKDDTSHGSTLPGGTTGRDNSQITQNGWSVGGNKHYTGPDSIYSGGDQTTSPGSRAELVTAANGV